MASTGGARPIVAIDAANSTNAGTRMYRAAYRSTSRLAMIRPMTIPTAATEYAPVTVVRLKPVSSTMGSTNRPVVARYI